jgi:hypothetical protein
LLGQLPCDGSPNDCVTVGECWRNIGKSLIAE